MKLPTTTAAPAPPKPTQALPVLPPLPEGLVRPYLPPDKKKPFWNLYRDGITQGWLSTFNDCLQKARLGLIEGLSTAGRGGGALEFGSLFHEVLDAAYTRAKTEARRADGNAAAVRALSSAPWLPDFLAKQLTKIGLREKKKLMQFPSTSRTAMEDFEENFGLVSIMVYFYFKRWAQDLADYDWQALEQKFSVPYSVKKRLGIDRPDIHIRGKIDGTFRVKTRRLWLFETKTKGQIDEDSILDGLSYNLQVQEYMWAMRYLYSERPEGVLYNVIRRPMLRRTKADKTLQMFLERVKDDVEKRPDHYFIRYTCIILPSEIKKWEEDFDSMMLRLVLWHEGIGNYRNPSACKGRWGRCAYMPICGRNDRSRFMQRQHIFPELEDGEDA